MQYLHSSSLEATEKQRTVNIAYIQHTDGKAHEEVHEKIDCRSNSLLAEIAQS